MLNILVSIAHIVSLQVFQQFKVNVQINIDGYLQDQSWLNITAAYLLLSVLSQRGD